VKLAKLLQDHIDECIVSDELADLTNDQRRTLAVTPITARCADDHSAWRAPYAVGKYLQIIHDPRVWHVIVNNEIAITEEM
jgi:hypothetical protein